MGEFKANKGKKLIINVDEIDYLRIPIKTRIIGPNDRIEDILDQYARDLLQDKDIVLIAEKVVACMQQRLINIADVEPRNAAKLLAKFVSENQADLHDPGLALPETMEMVMREVGPFRILFAAIASGIGKILGKKGWFYKIAGPLARDIDGPTPYVIEPYRDFIILNPLHPEEIAKKAKAYLTTDIAIVDVNDLGGNILANTSPVISNDLLLTILKDNPLGQSNEQTPLGIIRKKEVPCEKI